MAKKLPKEILIYVADELDDGTPVYGVAINVDEIPVENNGDRVGVYALNKDYKFSVKYGLDG